jgi:hypothetical protein
MTKGKTNKMKFSKTAHIQIIEEIAKGMKAAGMNGAYLELGIAKAHCINRVGTHFKNVVAVDINKESLDQVSCCSSIVPLLFSYEGTTDDFFESYDGMKFDLIFIDANHDYKNVNKDFYNSLKVLKEEGIIILHDTFAPDKESASHCKDAWKIQHYLVVNNVTCVSNLQFINLPFYYGLTLVKRHTTKDWWQM